MVFEFYCISMNGFILCLSTRYAGSVSLDRKVIICHMYKNMKFKTSRQCYLNVKNVNFLSIFISFLRFLFIFRKFFLIYYNIVISCFNDVD